MNVVTVNADRCKGCGLCLSACTKKLMCFSDMSNKSGQKIAVCAFPEKCVGCKSCGIICPDDAITIDRD